MNNEPHMFSLHQKLWILYFIYLYHFCMYMIFSLYVYFTARCPNTDAHTNSFHVEIERDELLFFEMHVFQTAATADNVLLAA